MDLHHLFTFRIRDSMKMRLPIPVGSPLTLATLLLFPITAVHSEDWDAQQAEAVFRNKCSHCHTAPDTESSFDRAWIGQVNRTA
jgi:mono/diheme cytochrome c family protein